MSAKVLRLEYDPNRSAFIALVEYEDGERRYILAPVGIAAGDSVVSSASADIKPGNCLPLENIPVGTVIHNIELYPGRGASSSAPPASPPSSWPRRPAWPPYACPAARCARSAWTAAPR